MPDYSNGKIYAIRSHLTDQVYIGSTVERLSARMSKHRADLKRHRAGKFRYITSFKMFDFPDAYIELIEKHPCLCREELERAEGQYIRADPNAVNRAIMGRTHAEWYQDNIDLRKQKHSCDCSGKYTLGDKAKHFKTKKHQKYEQFMALTEDQIKAMVY
jgi:hypothetical protein